MIAKAGGAARVVSDPGALAAAERLILPGVGAWDAGVERLRAGGWWDPILAFARAGKPLLGVCLGMQLLSEGSAEGRLPGLGLVRGACERLPEQVGGQRLRVPHMGWNDVRPLREAPLLRGLEREARFYFAHSYRLVCADEADVAAVAEYGAPITAYVRRGAVQGVQFHPEKSHRFGLTLFRNLLGGA
jgi:glutamine amidotransferase